MKNIKIIIAGLAMIFAISSYSSDVFAQKRQTFALTALNAAGTVKATPDTTTNTDTTYLVLSDGSTGIKPYNEYNDLVYYWSIVPGITGTTTGSIVLQGSMTGTFSASESPISDWVTLTPVTSYSTADSVSYTSPAAGFTASRKYKQFTITTNQYKYHRIRFISGGTQTSVITGRVSVLPH